MSVHPYDRTKFLSRIIDGTYVVLWSIEQRRWIRVASIDGSEGLRIGSLLLDDPAGSKPAAELLKAGPWCDHGHTQRSVYAAYGL